MAPQTIDNNSTTSQATNAQREQAGATVSSGSRQYLKEQQSQVATNGRYVSPDLDPIRKELADKVYNSFGHKVFQDLAQYHPNRSAQWLAEKVVDQAEVNAKNAFKQLDAITDEELARAMRTTLSQIKNDIITPREGSKTNNSGLVSNSPYHIADAILASVTHYGARTTLQNYRAAIDNDAEFVKVVKPALTRGEVFAWSNASKYNAEKQQRDLVHMLLMDGTIDSEYRYKAKEPGDLNAIGLELDQRKKETERRFAESRQADEQRKEAMHQEILDGYLSGARSEAERAQTMRNWKKIAESPATDEAHAARLTKALDKARANDPRPAPTSTYIDSTRGRNSAADIGAAERFAPQVAAAMKAKDPVGYEQSRPATKEEIAQLRQKLQETQVSVERGLERSSTLSDKMKEVYTFTSTSPDGQRLGQDDSAKLTEYQRSCRALQSSLHELNKVCSALEKAHVSDSNYQQLLTQFKNAQRDILEQGGLNDHRAKLGNELVAIERRYRLGTEEAKNLAALERLSPEEKRKSLVTLEGTLSAQLKEGADISHTLKAIEKLDSDPRRIASYLYRLERDGKPELVAKFAQSISSDLRNSLEAVLVQSQATLSDAQKKTVASIQDALEWVA